MAKEFSGQGKVVTFTYLISDESGELLEESDLPISYVHGGKHELFEKVEQGLKGAAVGDKVEIHLSPEEGFGHYDASLNFTDDLENVPVEYQHIGAEVEVMNDQGDTMTFTVTAIENGKFTVDGNHPLAGKSVIFNIEVVGIRDATPEEIENGVEPISMPVLH